MKKMNVREAARAIVYNEEKKVLLIKIEDDSVVDPKCSKKSTFWVTPGGGLEPGESYQVALKRELKEELGMADPTIEPCVWRGEVDLLWKGVHTTIKERYFPVSGQGHRIAIDAMTQDEKRVYRTHAWFSSDAIRKCSELVLPTGLADLYDELQAASLSLAEKEIDLSTPAEKQASVACTVEEELVLPDPLS
jgi:8-oxo-dGTP pyrophosphatase MutT (NUDIX family)